MVEDLKNYESGQENENPMATLSDEKSFEEHMEDLEKDTSIGEKYYQQAEAEKARLIENAQSQLTKIENMTPEKFQVCANPDFWIRGIYSGEKEPIYRPYDGNNPDDVAIFNKYKSNKIDTAKRDLKSYEDRNIDELAKAYYNDDLMHEIATKLENNEDFTDEERKFLGDAPSSTEELFPIWKFHTPRSMNEGLIAIPSYDELLDPDDSWGEARLHPEWATVAKAQIREMIKEGKSLLHDSEEVQSALENMKERRAANPFAGETNTNSATGEARTFDLEENYPRQDGESDEEYVNRLKRIKLKTRQAEMRHD